MTPCLGDDAKEPQVTVFFDPLTLLRSINNSPSLQVTLRLLDQFGLANVRGAGASLLIGAEKYDSMIHAHIALDGARDGVLAVLQPESGDLRPENWIPAEVGSYATGRWNLVRSVAGVERIVEKIAGSQYWEQNVEKGFQERFGLELEKDVLQQLTGRGTLITWFEPPARLGSQVTLVAFEVKDAQAAQKSMEATFKKLNATEERESYAGATMYLFKRQGRSGESGSNSSGPRSSGESLLRRGTPMAMVLDKQLFICDSRPLLQLIARTAGSADSPRLTSRPEFDFVASEIHSILDGREPFYLSYNEPKEALQSVYDLANSSTAKTRLAGIGDRFAPAGILSKALQDKQLPPFSVVASYFSVGGAAMYDEPTGIHYFGFTTRSAEVK
jgi:hypothetical protein